MNRSVTQAGRRFAILERDEDGDIVVTLTDRSVNTEADAWVMTPGDGTVLRVVKFLAESTVRRRSCAWLTRKR